MATATKTLLVLLLHVLSCTIPSANQSNKDMDIDITSLMDTTLFCSVLKGVPKNIVSAFLSMQIRHANRVNPNPKVVASLYGDGDIKLNAEFQRLVPSIIAKGNISEGWLETTIENIPPAVYGNYSCVVMYHEGTSGYLEYKPRVIYIDQMSSGVLPSDEPAGFEGKVIQKLQVSCIKSSSNFCNKTFPVTLTSDDKNDSFLQEGIMLTWECGSGKETTCYLKDVWMNRTEKFHCITGNTASVSPNTRKCNTRDLDSDTGSNKQNQENKTLTIILGVLGGVVVLLLLVLVYMIYAVRHYKRLTEKLLTDAHPTVTGQDKTNPGSKSLDEAEASASNREALDLKEIVTDESHSVGSKVIDPPEDTAAEIEELTADGTKARAAVKPKQAKGMKFDKLRALLIANQTGSSNSSSV